jgi:uncharacterized membrane protein (UPF0127 family)
VLASAIAVTVLLAWMVAQLRPSPDPREGLPGWPVVTIRIGDTDLMVVEAIDTARGLAGLADLAGLDGMLFAYPEPQDPSVRRFHMTGVRFPLDALFFDADGGLIEAIAMPICEAGACPRYAPAVPYRWVVEVPSGTLETAPGDRLRVPAP